MKALVLGILGLGVAGNAGASSASEQLLLGQQKENSESTQSARIIPENKKSKKLKKSEIIEQIHRGSEWSPPSLDEIQQMDPEACKKILLELCTRYQAQGFPCVYGPTLGLFNPCPCEHDRVFAEKMTNKESSKKLSDLFRFTDAAYRQSDGCVAAGFCHVSRLESRLELLHKEIQEAWEKEKERCNELVNVAQRYQCQLQEPTQDQPPSTDETSVSLPEEFNSLRDEYIQGMSAWYGKLVKCDEVVSQRFEEFFATYQKYAGLKQMNDRNTNQLRTDAQGILKYFEGTTKPSEKDENPKNLTD